MTWETAVGTLIFVIFVTIFGSYYETAITKIIDLLALGITKSLKALKGLNLKEEKEKQPTGQPTEEEEQQ